MEPFLGEIRIMSFGFAPRNWASCFGQTLLIAQNPALFSLLGTMYGGDGRSTFALPNLSSRVPIHTGAGYTQGQSGGEQQHTLTSSEMPAHSHSVYADGTAASTNEPSPTAFLSGSRPQNIWGAATALRPMDPASIGQAGASQPHENRMPFLALNFCIALIGIFPSPN